MDHGNAAAIFTEVLLLSCLNGSFRLFLCHGAFSVVEPLRRCQVLPAHATRDEIFPAVSQHVEKSIVGLRYFTSDIPDEDPDNIGVDEAPNLGFALFKIAVKTGILERDRCLRRK